METGKSEFGSVKFSPNNNKLQIECSFDKGNRFEQGNKQVSFRAAVCQMN